MRDWSAEITKQLASVKLNPAREAEIVEELSQHLDDRYQELIASGLAEDAARATILQELANPDLLAEELRRVEHEVRREPVVLGAASGRNFAASVWQDVRYGLRQLRRNPGFTTVAVITLALGIGANTTIFSVVESLMLRPLPIHAPEQVAYLGFARPGSHIDSSFSYSEFQEIGSRTTRLFSSVTVFMFGGQEGGQAQPDGLTVAGQTKPIEVEFVAGDFFSMLGIQPYLGRLILPLEGKSPSADPVIVLSYHYWASRFGRDPSIVGTKAYINGRPVTVVGVAPKGFLGVTPIVETQGYLPLGMASVESEQLAHLFTDPAARNLVVLAREKPGADARQVQTGLNVLAPSLLRQFRRSTEEKTLRVYPLRPPGMVDGPNPLPKLAALFLILAALVLAIACINVANLLLVRAAAREREMVVRAALGAVRGRLVRQVLTESLLLAIMGCAAGIIAGIAGCRALSAIPLQSELPLVLNFSFDWRVFLYSLGAALLTGVLVGIVPALRASRRDVNEILHVSGRNVAGGRARLRRALVAVEIGASVTLLIVTGLFVRSLEAAQHASLGFTPDHVLNLSLDPHEIGYTPAQGMAFYREVLDRARASPGVRSSSLALAVPLGDFVVGDNLKIPGYQERSGESPPYVLYDAVSPDFFKTLGIALLRGRSFSDSDDENSAPVALVNVAMANRFWKGEVPIGKRFSVASDPSHSIEIVGLVEDSRIDGLSGPYVACFYLPLAQHYASGATLQIRTTMPPGSAAREAVGLIASIAPTMPVLRVETMTNALNGMNGLFLFHVGADLTVTLGLLALALAVVGVFGVVSYSVSERRREIAIRLALGAQAPEVRRMILRQGLTMVLAGVAIGVLAAFGIAGLVGNFLVGVTPTDPVTFAGVSLVIMAVALSASYIPARWATKVDPMVALRYE